MSPVALILFPVNIITVNDGTVSCSDTPRTRSEYSADVSALSICGHFTEVPRGMLSQTMLAAPVRRWLSNPLRRSSSLLAHAAAAGHRPKVAKVIMPASVVLPPPLCPATMKNAGRWSRAMR